MLWCCCYILANKSFNFSIFISHLEYLLLVFIFLSENLDFLQIACLHNLWFFFFAVSFLWQHIILLFVCLFVCFIFYFYCSFCFVFLVCFVFEWKNHYFTLIIERYSKFSMLSLFLLAGHGLKVPRVPISMIFLLIFKILCLNFV